MNPRSLKKFELFEPATVEEACNLAKELGKNAKFLAGGTEVMSCWGCRSFHLNCHGTAKIPKILRCFGDAKKPKSLINIKKIKGLKNIEPKNGVIEIGALVTLGDLFDSPVLNGNLSFIKESVRYIGATEIRNMATVGGNLLSQGPSAGLALPLLCLNATVLVGTQNGSKIVPLETLYADENQKGFFRITNGGMLVKVIIPISDGNLGGAYQRMNVMHSMMSPSIAIACVTIELSEIDDVCTDCRLVIGNINRFPHRARKAEDSLRGKPMNSSVIENVARLSVEGIESFSDGRGNAEYRKEVAVVMLRRALHESFKLAKER